MDPVQSYLSYVSAAMPAQLSFRPPLTLAVDLAGLAVALMNVRARPFAPIGARRLAWLAIVMGGLAPLLMTLSPWAGTFFSIQASVWTGAALGALLLALLLLAAAIGRQTRAGIAQRFAALVEIAGLLVTAVGLAGVTLPLAAAAGWVDQATLSALPVSSASDWWSVALAGALLVLAANAAGGMGSAVPLGRRVGLVLTAAAYTLVVAGVTFAPDWIAGEGIWEPYALAVHVADALALLALASATRHLLNRPAAAEYWARANPARPPARRVRARAASAPKPAHLVPAVRTSRTPEQVPALTNLVRPVVPPSALAPFSPPALRRTVVYGADVTATVQTAAHAGNEVTLARETGKAPLLPPDALRAAAPEAGEVGNALPTGGERTTGLRENRAPEIALSPQFVEAILTLQTEMLRAGRHYSFSELAEMFTEVQPRRDELVPYALGRAGALERLRGGEPAARQPLAGDDAPGPRATR